MKYIQEKLNEINGEVGIIVFSNSKEEIIFSSNEDLLVPLASAAKVGIGYCIAKFIEEDEFKWTDQIDQIIFNPKEDSKEIYPHLQSRDSLLLQEAVEVMIACHDSLIANRVVHYCGGWEKINQKIQSSFIHMNFTEDPRDIQNVGKLSELMGLMQIIYQGYKHNSKIWAPIVNGLVRQRGVIKGIASHHLTHMTGGLSNAAIDLGILGEFSKHPYLYILGANKLPNRFNDDFADKKIMELMVLLYKLNQIEVKDLN
ncbi:serine hydrolase [Cytobacillus gottheilii]|uniref:serine hydrolase n=1 Tax=Cytobacillus gottheilii TaxID=859144 RepID=UPI0009BAA7C8|nr:serine hydrolase [Cytobacillus gottheilii]